MAGRSNPWSRLMVGCRVLILMASRTLRLNQPSSLANTSTLFLLMTWPCSRQWSPTAVGWVLSLVWSFILVARVLPGSPTYRCWHCGHVTWYTTPHFCRSGVLSLGCTNKERMVWGGGTRPHHAHGKFLPAFLKFHGCKVGLCSFWPGSVSTCLWAWSGGSQMPILRIGWFLRHVSRVPLPGTCLLVSWQVRRPFSEVYAQQSVCVRCDD